MRYKLSLTLCVLSILSFGLTGNAAAAGIDYTPYEKILNTYVNGEGRVNYRGLKADRGPLDNFIRTQIENADLSGFTDNERKAFWINAYNALTLRLIVDNYPLRFGGIRTINWGRPWSIQMKAAGRELSLGDIEHEILRKWDPIDPRIHFAINCASGGCPKLPNTHFPPADLDRRLDFEARRFMNDPAKVRLDRAQNILYHSEILKWFDEDFLAVAPDLKSYILKYIKDDDRRYIQSHDVKLKTVDYDWSLNEQ
ncbi:MAG: DUF547 domain-containing protein [Candidatus Omnitrophica bacterium]|nr:DUF547 domain-containing protein [Candidatus Omnitrophota bacterium]MCB9720025.1 DUF547 domain-containing protein [Candidatus Omnitrophota bacterium]